MSSDQAKADTDASPRSRFEALRGELVALLADLPETRLSKPTRRHGWTLRHELTWLAAADEELRRRLELAADGTTEEPNWRRVRGEAMFAAQELRLAALGEHLANSGTTTVASLESHAGQIEIAAIEGTLADLERHTGEVLAALRATLGG